MQPSRKSAISKIAMSLALVLSISTAHAQIQFTDVTNAAGVAHQSETYGASWGDLNGDGYPDIFANNHRTRPSLFLNKGNGTFTDIGKQVHTWVYHQHADTHGGSWVDFDNDGDQDLLVSTGAGNPIQFLVNENGALIDRTLDYKIDLTKISARLAVWFDYNGDHRPDFFMANLNGTSKMYQQNANATFSDKSGSTKLACKGSQFGQLFDINGDGHLDLVCPSEAKFPLEIYNTLPLPWQKLFDAAAPNSLIPVVRNVVDDIIGDFNNDGRLDFFVLGGLQSRASAVVQGGPNNFESQLFSGTKGFNFVSSGKVTFNLDWNQADLGRPIDFAKIRIGSTGWHPTAIPFTLDPSNPKVAGMPTIVSTTSAQMRIGYAPATQRWTLILSANGHTSVAYLQINSTAQISGLGATGLWAGDKAARPTLLMNFSGGFSDETAAAGLSAPVQCGSVTAGDFDNDMDLDLYLVCRTGASNIQNILYENQGNGRFVAVPNAGGAGGPVGVAVASGAGTGDSVVTADYDVDGFLDLFVTNGLNMRPLYYGGPNKLFHNQGNGNHWIELQLLGTRSERDAVGSRIKATANGVTQLRVLNGGYHRWSQEHTPSHFGLAGNTKVDLRVEWSSGTVETFTNVAADKLYRITEGSGITTVIGGGGSQTPTLSVAPLSVSETAGQANFTVTLAPASAQTATVAYASADSTARAGADYTGVNGTLTFAAGQTSKTVSVPILDDALTEGNETFRLTLSNPVNAALSSTDGQATGTILDNEISACGAPIYNAGVTAAAFVWRDCTTGQWSARFTSGGSSKVIKYIGSVTADTAFTAVTPYSIESSDILDFTTNPAIISFALITVGSGQDGFNFTVPDGTSACFDIGGPAGATALVGSSKTPVSLPFDLNTQASCGGGNLH